MSDTILCMFSGGIDSAGVLHQMMTDDAYKDRQLIVHHIYLQNRENRADAEKAAVEKILNYYQRSYPARAFTYSSNVFDTRGFSQLKSKRFPVDIDVTRFIAANIAVIRKDIRLVVFGRTKTDVDAGGDNLQRRIQRGIAIFDAMYMNEREPIPDMTNPLIDKTKREVWEMLPPSVQTAVWYCRRPVYQDETAIACGKCITCIEVAEMLAEPSELSG